MTLATEFDTAERTLGWQQRVYSVEHHVSMITGWPFDWRLRIYGDGHWCAGNGQWSRHLSREDAERVGKAWVNTGIQPSEQAPSAVGSRAARVASHFFDQGKAA